MPAEEGQASVAGLGIVTSFSCYGELASDGLTSNLIEARVEISSVERQCWFTNSFVYRVTGSAQALCTGTIDGDSSTGVNARIEVEF